MTTETKPKRKYRRRRGVALKEKKPVFKFASNYEARVAKDLQTRKVPYLYEQLELEYVQVRVYTPDFLLPNGIIVETKGKWDSADRTKHLLIRKQHPDRDVRLLFMQNNKLRVNSKTRYGDWCDRHGIKWAVGMVPQEWIDE